MNHHLEEVDEHYFRHLSEAWRISAHCLLAALSAFFHGIFPAILKSTATDILQSITSRQRQRLANVDDNHSD